MSRADESDPTIERKHRSSGNPPSYAIGYRSRAVPIATPSASDRASADAGVTATVKMEIDRLQMLYIKELTTQHHQQLHDTNNIGALGLLGLLKNSGPVSD